MNRAFKLQKVLDFRALTLEREKAHLAELARKMQEIVNIIKGITDEIALKNAELAEEQDFNLAELYRKYIITLEKRRNQEQQRLNEQRKLVHQQKEKTKKAYNDKRIMDKLKEKHKAEYQAHINSEEVKFTDDIVSTREAVKSMADVEA